MAEPAQPEPVSVPTLGIKQEHDLMGLEGLDFSLPPELSSKRPLVEVDTTADQDAEAKRLKTENAPEVDSLEDGLALLVQNALSNVGDLVDQFNTAPDASLSVAEAMDLDDVVGLELPKPTPIFFVEPLEYLRQGQSYTLVNMALTLLFSLVQHHPVEELIKELQTDESDHCRSYRNLKRSFDSICSIFSNNSLLSASDLDGLEDAQSLSELINLARLASWLVEGSIAGYDEADKYFLAVFQQQLSDLPIGSSDTILAIKTQRAIKKLKAKQEDQSASQLIQEAMIHDLEERLREQHAGSDLTDEEKAFITLATARKDALEADTIEKIDFASLADKYPIQLPLINLTTHIKTRLSAASEIGLKYGVSIQLPMDAPDLDHFGDGTGDADMDLDDLSSFFEKTASGLVQDALAGLTEEEAGQSGIDGTNATEDKGLNGTAGPGKTGKIDFMTDYKELEALVAESTSNYVKTTLHGLSPVPYQPTVPTSTAESMTAQLPYLAQLQQHQAQHPYYSYSQPPPEQQPQQPVSGENLPPNQTFPSAILYDKARQAALSKSSAHTRREGLHSTRRPWTQEEEKALMAGLDMVKGPHWSQILTLFGQNGTISDILKDRTQVQLKDKARNLKLFFLKTNSEMPYYLQAVTGELKTRAPTQAARKEAEERARLNSEEDQAKLHGIMALAGGLQHPPQNRPVGPTAGGVSQGVLTPARAASVAQIKQEAKPTSAPIMNRPVAPAAQPARPGTHPGVPQHNPQISQQATTARPQTQLPPHIPRPQTQQQGQHGQQLLLPQQQQQNGIQQQQHAHPNQVNHQHQQQQQQQPLQQIRPAQHQQSPQIQTPTTSSTPRPVQATAPQIHQQSGVQSTIAPSQQRIPAATGAATNTAPGLSQPSPAVRQPLPGQPTQPMQQQQPQQQAAKALPNQPNTALQSGTAPAHMPINQPAQQARLQPPQQPQQPQPQPQSQQPQLQSQPQLQPQTQPQAQPQQPQPQQSQQQPQRQPQPQPQPQFQPQPQQQTQQKQQQQSLLPQPAIKIQPPDPPSQATLTPQDAENAVEAALLEELKAVS